MIALTENEKKVMEQARAYIDEPDKWIVDYLAKDADGNSCEPESPRAVSFCAIGAILRANDDERRSYNGNAVSVMLLTDKLSNYVLPGDAQVEYEDGWNNIAEFNNTSTYAEVIDFFDRAVA